MSNVARFPTPEPAPSLDTKDVAALEEVRKLIQSMAPEGREYLLSELSGLIRPIVAPRAGEVLGVLVKLLPRRPEWTVAEIKQEVDGRGVAASDKAVYNAIGYLARKGQVRRVGYGRYVVNGIEIPTSDDFGGENARYEDLYRET